MPIKIEYWDEEKTKIKKKLTVLEDGTIQGPFEEYFENGQLSRKGTFASVTKEDGEKYTGPYKTYYENGQLRKECMYDGETHNIIGPYIGYYENGQVKRKAIARGTVDWVPEEDNTPTIVQFAWIGPYEAYHENGQVARKCTFTGQEEPPFIGPYECRRKDGSIYARCTFSGQKKPCYIGEYTGYAYKGGEPAWNVSPNYTHLRCTYTEDGQLIGDYELKDCYGIMKSCHYSDDGKLDGEFMEVTYGRSTSWGDPVVKRIREHCFYKDGVLDGPYERFETEYVKTSRYSGHEREFLEVKGQYKNGTKVGHWEEGNGEFEYVDGLKNGPAIFHSNGSTSAGAYKNDEKDGIWETRDKDGKLIEREVYKDGKLNGPYERYEKGKLVKKGTYKNGKYTSDTEFEAQLERERKEEEERRRLAEDARVREENERKADIEAAKDADSKEFRKFVSKYIKKKDYRTALTFLQNRGLLKGKKKDSDAKFDRNFDVSVLGWGESSLHVTNDLVGIDMRELSDDVIAVGEIYEDRHWKSVYAPTSIYSGGIGWYWRGNVTLVHLDKGCGPTNETETKCVRHPNDSTLDIFGEIPRTDFLTVKNGKATVSLGRFASASVDIPESEKPAKKAEPKKNKAETDSKKETKGGIRKKLDLLKKAHTLDEASASIRHERESVLANAMAGITDAKKRLAVRRRTDVSDLRIKEDKARAAKLSKLLKGK